MSKIRVIQYGVGPIGAGIVRLLAQKSDVQIVGAVDVDPAKVGKDLGRVAGLERDLGVLISSAEKSVLRSGADVVLHTTQSYLQQVKEQLMNCMEAGLHVVSTCEELSYPYRKHPELSAVLDRVAKQNKVVLYGTGVNPGFAMDKLAITLSAACQQVTRVNVHRVVDASKRRLPLQKKVGAGMTPQEFRAAVNAGNIKHHGLPESVAMIADALGLTVDRISETIDPVVATETVRSEYLEVPAGRVAGVRQVALGTTNGDTLIRLELEMYLGAKDPVDAVSILGVPDLNLRIDGGIHGDLATAAIAVNAVPAVMEAQPGLRTSRDIPLAFFPAAVAKAVAV